MLLCRDQSIFVERGAAALFVLQSICARIKRRISGIIRAGGRSDEAVVRIHPRVVPSIPRAQLLQALQNV